MPAFRASAIASNPPIRGKGNFKGKLSLAITHLLVLYRHPKRDWESSISISSKWLWWISINSYKVKKGRYFVVNRNLHEVIVRSLVAVVSHRWLPRHRLKCKMDRLYDYEKFSRNRSLY
jgi:hypothetical protein